APARKMRRSVRLHSLVGDPLSLNGIVASDWESALKAQRGPTESQISIQRRPCRHPSLLARPTRRARWCFGKTPSEAWRIAGSCFDDHLIARPRRFPRPSKNRHPSGLETVPEIAAEREPDYLGMAR